MILAIYIVLLVFQIMLLVKAISKKKTERWVLLSIFEWVSSVFAIIMMEYYDSLPGEGWMPGFTHLGEWLSCFGAAIAYVIMLAITLCIWIVMFEKKQKSEGKKHANPFLLIIACAFIIFGFVSLTQERICNYKQTKSTGTILDIKDYEGNRKVALISFDVEGNKYKDEQLVANDAKIGDNIEVYYTYWNEQYVLDSGLMDNKSVYLSAFGIGAFFILIRVLKRNKK